MRALLKVEPGKQNKTKQTWGMLIQGNVAISAIKQKYLLSVDFCIRCTLEDTWVVPFICC